MCDLFCYIMGGFASAVIVIAFMKSIDCLHFGKNTFDDGFEIGISFLMDSCKNKYFHVGLGYYYIYIGKYP